MNNPDRLSRLLESDQAIEANKVLIVDDSRAICHLLGDRIDHIDGIDHVAVNSMAQAREVLETDREQFYCAILDLNLPDAPRGEVVDYVREQGVPVVVLTGSLDQKLREDMLAKEVVDYVSKGNVHEIEYVANLVGRLYQNQMVKVLVVDDSPSFRQYLVALLERYRYQVLTANDGEQALQVLEEHPDTTLVLTDYNMPKMNGMQLIQSIRNSHRREDLAVIAMSDASKASLSAMMLKAGANDFLTKPFEVEEFYCRVTQNTNMVGYVRQMRDAATLDFLTRCFNRRYLFDIGEVLHANARRGDMILAAAVIDADHFKRVNDTWGHQVGDDALRLIAQALQDCVRKSDIVARYGGEEFVCLAALKNRGEEQILFERIRAAVESIELEVEGEKVPLTASIGVTLQLEECLDEMLKLADDAVYKAKQAGRNCVMAA